MEILQLVDVDGELAVIFPDALVEKLQVSVGDDIHLTPTKSGFSLHSDHAKSKVFFGISRNDSAPQL